LVGKSEGRKPLEDKGAEEREVLKLILNEYDGGCELAQDTAWPLAVVRRSLNIRV
jgi:hypothetical protein